MEDKEGIPVARAGAHRAGKLNTIAYDLEDSETNGAAINFQVIYMVRRYQLTPTWARLISSLANIGGRSQ